MNVRPHLDTRSVYLRLSLLSYALHFILYDISVVMSILLISLFISDTILSHHTGGKSGSILASSASERSASAVFPFVRY